jgi:hypothetical protein
MAGFCECGNELPVCLILGINCLAEDLLTSPEGLCCMELFG